MTIKELNDHTLALLDLLRDRGLCEYEACNVMGNALTLLIQGREQRSNFVEVLRKEWNSFDRCIGKFETRQ